MFLTKARRRFYRKVGRFYAWKYRKLYGMDIGEGAIINRSAFLDTAINPKGIHIGAYTRITRHVTILSHDACRKLKLDTYIGSNSLVGINSIILPGVHVGNHCVIGAGSVVTKDVPDHCIAAGNPAKVIKTGISLVNGKIVYPDEIVGVE